MLVISQFGGILMKETTYLNLSADDADQPIPELDLEKDVRALDKII